MYIMQLYSVTKKSKNSLFEGKLRQLERTLEELSQNQKDNVCFLSSVDTTFCMKTRKHYVYMAGT